MKNILTIARKELREVLRDKRTLMMMVVIPLVLFPVIMSIIISVSTSYGEDEMKKEMRIGIISNGQAEEVIHSLMTDPMIDSLHTFYTLEDTSELKEKVELDSLDIGLIFPASFDEMISEGLTANLFFVYDGTEDVEKARTEQMIIENIKAQYLERRLKEADLTHTYINPINVEEMDTASNQAKIGKYAGGILPYIFISFCFLGCMYPAIDLFAGEKERGTIETLLTAPVVRHNILIGKMVVIVLSGLLSATLAIVGLLVSIQFMDIPANILAEVNKIITPQLLGSLYVLLIPLVIFFAGAMIPLSIYSKSYKEAQSIVAPLNMVVVLPAIVGFFPGVEYNLTTALIPIVNIVLGTKDIIGGDPNIGLLAISFGVLVLFAALAVMISFKQFGREGNILRGD